MQRRAKSKNKDDDIRKIFFWALIAGIMLLQQIPITLAAYKDDPCETKGMPGVCKGWGECPIIKTLIERREYTNREVVSCGFGVREELICCPVIRTETKIENICDMKSQPGDCKKWSECATIQAFIEAGEYTSREVASCGFDVYEEMICCPLVEFDRKIGGRANKDRETTTTTTPPRKRDFWLDVLESLNSTTTTTTTQKPDFWLDYVTTTPRNSPTTTTTIKPLIIGDQRLDESSEFFDFSQLLKKKPKQNRTANADPENVGTLNNPPNLRPQSNPSEDFDGLNGGRGQQNTGRGNSFFNSPGQRNRPNNNNNQSNMGGGNFGRGRGQNRNNGRSGNGNQEFTFQGTNDRPNNLNNGGPRQRGPANNWNVQNSNSPESLPNNDESGKRNQLIQDVFDTTSETNRNEYSEDSENPTATIDDMISNIFFTPPSHKSDHNENPTILWLNHEEQPHNQVEIIDPNQIGVATPMHLTHSMPLIESPMADNDLETAPSSHVLVHQVEPVQQPWSANNVDATFNPIQIVYENLVHSGMDIVKAKSEKVNQMWQQHQRPSQTQTSGQFFPQPWEQEQFTQPPQHPSQRYQQQQFGQQQFEQQPFQNQQFGQQSQFGQQLTQQREFGQQDQFGQQPQFGQRPQHGQGHWHGQRPHSGQRPQSGQQNQFEQQPQFGQPPSQQQRPVGRHPSPQQPFPQQQQFGLQPQFGQQPSQQQQLELDQQLGQQTGPRQPFQPQTQFGREKAEQQPQFNGQPSQLREQPPLPRPDRIQFEQQQTRHPSPEPQQANIPGRFIQESPNGAQTPNVQSPPAQILDPFKPFEFRPPPKDELPFEGDDNAIRPDPETTTPATTNTDRPAVKACRRIEKGLNAGLTHHILGGTPSELGEFPHMAAIGYSRLGDNGEGPYDIRCGGSLIDSRFVLTAAHCVASRDSTPSIVRLGAVNFTNPDEMREAVEIKIKTTHIHNEYSQRRTYNDIAVLELERPVTFSEFIYPICLYTDEGDPKSDVRLWVSGWGTLNVSTRAYSNILLKAALHVTPLERCNDSFIDYGLTRQIDQGIIKSQLCAEDADQVKDACQGDSGGPLHLIVDESYKNYRLVGVVSSGFGCASSTPGLYTRVAAFLNFVEQIVWPNGGD